VSFSINTNIPSLQAQDNLRLSSDFQGKTISRVTSGLRIVSSGDDAAGLAIANGFRSDIAVLSQGVRNANDGLSTLQTIDGGINNISKLLDRARTLATQSASGTFTGSRNVLSSEFKNVLGEIDRQAQAIGLDAGGQFAKALQVFIGGGKANHGTSEITNGAVAVDLSQSTVDSQGLGLKGVQASGAAGTDIGTGAAATKVSDILANAGNTGSEATGGFTDFYFQGPGFSDSSRVKVSVNTSGVTDVDTLATAINAAIDGAGNGTSQAATAFKNAGIRASVNTDSTGKKQLAFNSSTTAFQVDAGDRVSSAFLGQFEQNASLTGTNATASLATNGGGTANQLTVAIDGGSAFTVNVTNAATVSKGQIVNDLNANGTFSAAATAYLQGNQIVLRSKGNSSSSAVAITSTTLSTNLGLTGTATAAAASTGADLSTRVQGNGATASGATAFGTAGAGNITVRLTGADLSSPVDLSLSVTSTTTVAQAVASLQTAVSGNGSLQTAGITLTSATAGNNLVFTSNKGEKFNVAVTGDVLNNLGFGSFVNGAAGAADYSTIQGLTYNNTTSAAGTNAALEFSINGAASNSNGVTVDLTAGDATAATVTSSDSSTSVVNVTGNNNQLNLVVNGTAVNVTLAAGARTKNDIANSINTAFGVNGSATVVNNAITLTSATKGRGGSIEVLAGTGNAQLGFTASATPTFGTSRTGQSVADALNTAFAANSTLQTAGLQASFGGGQITVASNNGTFFRVDARGSTSSASVEGSATDTTAAVAGFATVATAGPYTIVAGASDQFKIKVDGNAAVQITLSAGALTAAQVAADLNNGKLTGAIVGNALGATASVDGTGHLVITSNTAPGVAATVALSAGTNDALAVLGASTSTAGAAAVGSNLAIGGTSNKLRISVDGGANVDVTLTTQTSDAATIAADAQTQINAALTLAGQTAQVTVAAASNGIKITSNSSGAGSSIAFSAITNDAYTAIGLTSGVTYTGHEANLGYGTTGSTFTGNSVSSAPATSSRVDAGGSAATNAVNFAPLAFGSDDQVITIATNDSSGAAQSQAITLRNDATGRSGRSLDEAINAINTALHQTNNPTLQNIVAVKDNSSGTEQLRFLSTNSSFKVAIGTTGGSSADGAASQGTTLNSAITNGGSTLDISSQSTAEQAVTALSAAVSKLGDAQAVVGRGQNQFSFAVNLATSQLSNLAAAESRIRDADLAAEAANLTKASISLQAGVAALAQANSAPQQVLALLRA
jgi:flagellin